MRKHITILLNMSFIVLCAVVSACGNDPVIPFLYHHARVDSTSHDDPDTIPTPDPDPEDTTAFDTLSLLAWKDGTAVVTIPKNKQQWVTAQVDGGHVTITNTNEEEEMLFELSGVGENASFTYVGSYKCKILLNGVSLTSDRGAALDILCGKRIDLLLADSTENTLSDAVGGEQKGALHCKGHLEIGGAGTLNVSGNARHAISTNEYLKIKSSAGTVNIKKAASDALHVGQYFMMNGGKLNILDNLTADGIQVDATDNPADTLNGQVVIKAGEIAINVSGQDCKGIKTGSDVVGAKGGDITISGGKVIINANGRGSRGMQTDANMLIATTTATTTINVNANGAQCTLPECADDPHRCMGIKVGGNLTVTGGTTTVTNKGTKSRAIKVGGTYKKTGGVVIGTVITD